MVVLLKIGVACAKLDLMAFLKKIFFLNLGEVMAKKGFEKCQILVNPTPP